MTNEYPIYKYSYTEQQNLRRLERDAALADSDWTQLLDCPLDGAKIAEFATYRQALRDWPSNFTEENIEDLELPEVPIID
jgi:hypothetical protein